LMCLIC